MLSVAKIAFEIRRRNDPEQQAAKPAATDLPAPCGGCAKEAGRVPGGPTKRKGHEPPQTPAHHRSQRKPFLSRAAPPPERRFSPHAPSAPFPPPPADPPTPT